MEKVREPWARLFADRFIDKLCLPALAVRRDNQPPRHSVCSQRSKILADEMRCRQRSIPAALPAEVRMSPSSTCLVREICGSPLRSNGGRKLGLRDSVAALLPGSRACE